MPFASATPIEIPPHKKINVILGTPAQYPENFTDGEFYIYISPDIKVPSATHIRDYPHLIFKLKSGEAVHPVCYALWKARAETTYISTETLPTIYDLLLLVKSYNRDALYGFWDHSRQNWHTTPYRPTSPFRKLDQEAIIETGLNAKHLKALQLELNYYAINKIPKDIYDCKYHLFSTASEIIVLLICYFDVYINYVGSIQCHMAVLEVFRETINLILSNYVSKE